MHLFHSQKKETFARVPVNNHEECHAIASKTFKELLTYRFYQQQKTTPGRDSFQSFLDVLSARALFDGPEEEVFQRIAHVGQRIYLDLCNPAWEVVEVDADDWRIVPKSPVNFRRAPGMKALPPPTHRGSLEALRPFVNAKEDSNFVLMISWLVGTFLAKGGFPILLLQGTQDSGKSSVAIALRTIMDPATPALSRPPDDERNLVIAASNSHIVVFDNVSGVPKWLSDALCSISTGAGFRTRKLNTDDTEMLFENRSPLILNGIDGIAIRGDLVDRGIDLTLTRIADEERITVEDLQAGFDAVHPEILGALLSAVSAGLRNLSKVRLTSLPRMADFAKWLTACEPALPWKPGTFMREYLNNRQSAAETSVANDSVAHALVTLVKGSEDGKWKGLKDGKFEGSAEELRIALNRWKPCGDAAKFWPSTAASLGKWLRRAQPALLAVGVTATDTRTMYERTWTVKYSKPPEQSAKSPDPPEQGALPLPDPFNDPEQGAQSDDPVDEPEPRAA
jgi:hypothetical protein